MWERTTRRVLTLSDVTAIKIGDVEALRAAGIEPAAFIDFGMMGHVPTELRAGLRRIVIAVAARDGKALVAGTQQIGVLVPGADTTELERALTELFARFGGLGFGELQDVDPREFRRFADEFGETMRELPVQLPENFLLITRAVSLTSGLCSALDPGFNVWHAVEPFAQRLLRRRLIAFGVLSPLSYILVLTAITLAPVALVAPMRELSVVLVSLFGVFVLRDGRAAGRVGASVLVAAGVVLLAV